MKEMDLQRWIIDVVRERGGAAYKLSHAYSVGVSDLLIKLPDMTPASPLDGIIGRGRTHVVAMLLEVKQKYGERSLSRLPFKLDVSAPQVNFMRSFEQAGMRVGVLSFLQKGKIKLSAAIFELDALKAANYTARPADHEWLGKGPQQQADTMYQILADFAAHRDRGQK